MFGDYKILVNSEAESKEVQKLFFELGYEWNGSGKEVVSWRLGLLFTKDFQGKNCLCYFDKDEDVMLDAGVGKELTLPELRDLVVLHRNDVNDATHKYIGGGAAYKTVDDIAYLWTRMGWDYKGVAHDLVPLHKEDEQGLISGADALHAIADGKDVECRAYEKNWINANNKQHPLSLFFDDCFQFRLKPRTITLSVEIPAPFEPKDGDEVWFIDDNSKRGYSYSAEYGSDIFSYYGFWRTEQQIKQVVAALRNSIKGVENV